VLRGEVTVGNGNDTRDTTTLREDCHALRFMELIPQRVRPGPGSAHTQVPVARDLADDVGGKIEPTRDDSSMRSIADAPDEVSKAIHGPLSTERAAERSGGLIF
jgi:hypothetical protein